MSIRFLRPILCAAAAALVALSWSDRAAAVGSPIVTAAVGVPTPNAGAPSGTLFPLSSEGYTESEFFIEGTASSYHNAAGPPFAADGIWTIEPDAAPTPAYKTRIQVYRPADPDAFSGVVIVEWLNVTNQSDSAADWILAHNEMIRRGHVYVGATTQAVGVNAARTQDANRYGASGANLVHPGDSYSYDIFSQIAQAIRENQSLILGGLTLGKLIAAGESQSASRMVTYIDALAVLHGMYDGYYVHSRGTTGAALRASITGPPALAAIATPGPTLIRTDMTQPVFVMQTETDTRGTRQADTAVFRQWESAGSAHADMYTLGIGQFDHGLGNTAAQQLFFFMQNPTNEPLPGILPPCGLPVNSGPHHWVVQASLHHLAAWVADGVTPPASQLLTTVDTPTSALVLDANGNATGGVRSPHVDAPVAAIRGTGQPPGNLFCSLFGTTTPFTQEQFDALYADQAGFEAAWNDAVDDSVANGFVLWSDQWKLKFLPEPAALAGLAAGGLALRALARRRRTAARD
jgi:hypothetical protein